MADQNEVGSKSQTVNRAYALDVCVEGPGKSREPVESGSVISEGLNCGYLENGI